MHKRFSCAALAAAVALFCVPAHATVPSTANTVSYTGNGSSNVFATTFTFLKSADLVVTVNGVAKTLGTDYTVLGAGNATGTVTFTSAPASSAKVVIARIVDLTQQTSLRSQRNYDPGTLEAAIDKLAMGEQQLAAGFFSSVFGVTASCTGDGCTGLTAIGHNGGIGAVMNGSPDDGHFGAGGGIVARGGDANGSGNSAGVGGTFTGGADDGTVGAGPAIVATGGAAHAGGGAPGAELHGTGNFAGVEAFSDSGAGGHFTGNATKGAIKIEPQAQPSAHTEGEVYYDSAKHSLMVWIGSQWVDVSLFRTFNLPMPASVYGAVCDGSNDDTSALAAAEAANAMVWLPKGNCKSTATVIFHTGHKFVGQGAANSMITSASTGCGALWDGSDGGGMEGIKLAMTSTASTVRGVCLTNVSGGVLRMRFVDCFIIGQSVTGTYGIFVHATTGNSCGYYTTFISLVTLNWDRGVELLGDVSSGGANAVWFFGYSSNANVTGIYIDGKSGDNYVQGHCNASGTTFTQVCAVLGDGTHTSSGSEIHLVSDTGGSWGSVVTCAAGAVNNFIFAVNESSGADTVGCDSTNFMFFTRAAGVASRNVFLPSGSLSGTYTVSNDLFIGGSRRDTGVLVKTNTDYTLGQHDRTIAVAGLTAAHTITLAANGGQVVTIGDSDNSITGSNTLSIAPPGGGGKINGSASNLVFTTAGKSARCEPLTANALIWSCTVSP